MTTRTTRAATHAGALRFMFDRRYRADPYPLYDRLRRAAPVFHSAMTATLLTRYDDVMAAAADPRLSSVERTADFSYAAGSGGAGQVVEAPFRFVLHRAGVGVGRHAAPTPFIKLSRLLLIGMDPPDHTRLRGLVARSFTPRVIAQARENIQKLANELIDQLEPRRRADLLADYAYQFPVRVICQMLGVPAEDYVDFHEWVNHLVQRLDVANVGSKDLRRRADDAAAALATYLGGLASERRLRPRDDLLTGLVGAADDGDRLSGDELVSVVALLLAAGHETTANLIGNSVWHLSRHMGQLDRWRTDPEVRRGGVDELLRFDSPVQMVMRVATTPVDFDGVTVPTHRIVIPLLGAANRDPARFDDPDRLDLSRPNCAPASFGFGIHHCIGATLARLECEIALTTLYLRVPNVQPTIERPTWRSSIVFRGLEALPVAW
jgi:cytochrome P450